MEMLVISLVTLTIVIHIFAIKHFTKLSKYLENTINAEKKLNEKTTEVLLITFNENQSLKDQLNGCKADNVSLNKKLKSITDQIDLFNKMFDK